MTRASAFPEGESRNRLEERARVVEAFPGGAWVAVAPHAGCGACHARQGCGAGLLARLRGGGAERRLAVTSERPLRVGEEVCIALPAATFLEGALGVYGLPLVTSLGAGLGAESMLSSGHWGVPLAFALGLAAGVVALRRFLGQRGERYRPRVLPASGTPPP